MRLIITVLLITFISEMKCEIKNISEIRKPYINKCCQLNQVVFKRPKNVIRETQRRSFCSNTDHNQYLNFSNIKTLDNKVYLDSSFDIVPGYFESNSSFYEQSLDISLIHEFNLYLIENVILAIEIPNTYNRWTFQENSNYCIDYVYNNDSNKNTSTIHIWIAFENEAYDSADNNKSFPEILVKSVLVLLMLLMYSLVPKLRNLAGLLVIPCVTSLFLAYSLLATLEGPMLYSNTGCIYTSCAIYFSFLSSFSWMNVMSYDMWRTVKPRPKCQCKKTCLNLKNFSYALGIPLSMTIFLRVVDTMDLTNIPYFIKPMVPNMGCYLEGGQKLVYLEIPLIILSFFNFPFYLMTVKYLWLNRHRILTIENLQLYRLRFLLYVKLMIMMQYHLILELFTIFGSDKNLFEIYVRRTTNPD